MNPITITLLFLVFAIVMFIWEKIPLALTAMIVAVGLALTGAITYAEAFAGFTNPTVILFAGMFVVGGALFETGMANELGNLLTKFAKTERLTVLTIMMIAGFAGAFLSNTGIAAILIPIVTKISMQTGFSRSRLLMPLALASTLGGDLTLIGTPGNMIAHNALVDIGSGFGFFEFGLIGLPILLLGIVYYLFFGYKLLPATDKPLEEGAINDVQDFSHVPQWKKNMSLIVLIGVVLGMIFESQLGLPLFVISSIGAIVLVATRVMSEKQAYASMDMKVIFLFAGVMALTSALQSTGASELIATRIVGLLGENPSEFMILAVILFITCTFTMFLSNTCTAALLVPINLGIALTVGADPRGALMATAIGSSWAFASPISTPANAMVLHLGGYKYMDYVKVGLPLVIISFITAMILIPIFFPLFP